MDASALRGWGTQARHVVSRWLFREGGQYNCAIARIAIGVALWLTVTHGNNFSWMASNWDAWVLARSGSGWTPKGLIKLADAFWSGPPPAALTLALYHVAVASCVTMILGLFTPVSQVVATLSSLYLVSLETSFGPYWSHAYNVQLLAAIAFMFSRHAGDVWSLDALVRRLRGLAPRFANGHYWWPVIFAELATAMFMFGAFFQKFRDTGVFWALSDNIRNSLVVTWFQYRSDPPEIALWMASEPLIWKTAGLLQLFAQATTILAAFLVARPVFRFIFGGLFFAAEILALGHVFRFWHPFWAPLCLLSVDFEHFYRRLRGERRVGSASRWGKLLGILFQHRVEERRERQHLPAFAVHAGVLAFGLVFFGYYAANLVGRLGEKHLNYPFSTMGFYSVTRDRPPYGKHHYYPIYTGRIDAYEAGSDLAVPLWYRVGGLEDSLFRVNTIEMLKGIHTSYVAKAHSGLMVAEPSDGGNYTTRPVQPVRIVYRAGLMAVPPFPQPAGLVEFHMGHRAVYDDKGFRALVARTRFDPVRQMHYVQVESEGFASPSFEVLTNPGGYDGDKISEPVAMRGRWEEDRFYVDQPFDQAFTLIEVTDPVLGVKERYYGSDVF